MRVHHLNCATMCPFGGRLIDGASTELTGRLVAHVLLLEAEGGLTLVDTGIGRTAMAGARATFGAGFLALARPQLRDEETAIAQLERLGFGARDVRDIVLTHLDPDHAGGLGDFPDARVHVHAPELDTAERPTLRERPRYRAALWAHNPRWVRHSSTGERWLGFEGVRALDEKSPEVLLVPLVGHTRGHAGVAVRTRTGWLLHAGDAYFHRDQLREPPRCPPGLSAFQALVDWDREQRLANQARLRTLAREHAGKVQIFCAHDAEELRRHGG